MRVGVVDKEKTTAHACLSLSRSLSLSHTHIHTQGNSQASATAEKESSCCAPTTQSVARGSIPPVLFSALQAGFYPQDSSCFFGYNFSQLLLLILSVCGSRTRRIFYPLAPLQPLHADPLHLHHAFSLTLPLSSPFFSPHLSYPGPSPLNPVPAALPKDSSKAWRAPSTATLPAIT